MDACYVANSQQCVPVSMTGRIFFWNMTTFNKAGITEVPKSLDCLLYTSYCTSFSRSMATCSPSKTNLPFTLRQLQMALRPQVQMVFILSLIHI